MNPLNGMTMDKIRADMHKSKIRQESQNILSNIRYSIEIKRSYFLLGNIQPENIDHLLKNGFHIQEISIVSNQSNHTMQHYVVYWEKLNDSKAQIESAFPGCQVEWHPHKKSSKNMLSKLFPWRNTVSPSTAS